MSRFMRCVFFVFCFTLISFSAYAESHHDIIDFSNEVMTPLSPTLKPETGGFGSFNTETDGSGNANDYYNIGVSLISLTQDATDAHLQYSQYRDFASEVEYRFSVRFTNDTNGSMNACLRHKGTNEKSYGTLGLVGFNAANCQVTYLSEYGKNVKETLERGKWYSFVVYFNLAEDTITVARDGVVMASANQTRTYNDKLRQYNYEEAMPRFQVFVSKSKVSNKVSFDIDNVEFKGNESLNSDYFVTNKKLYTIVGGNELESDYIRKGQFAAKASVKNKNEQQNKKCTLAVGLYNESGEMAELFKSSTYDIAPGQETEAKCEFSVDSIEGGEYVKVFLIDDFENLMPLAVYDQYPESLLNPYGEDILRDVKQLHPNNGHPRLMLTDEKLNYLKTACFDTEPYKSWYLKIRASADQMIEKGFAVYDDLDELRLQGISTTGSNITTLAFVYAIESAAGNPAEKYAKRIVDEMINVSVENPEWDDWNPKHFLDTSAALVAFGLAYDWCYDYFNRPENAGEKEMMFNTLKVYGLEPSKLAYNQISNYWWTNTNNNWNMVCNAGVAVASLAVCDEDGMEDITAELLQAGLKSVRKCFNDFAPDGAWFEGTGYWHYTVNLMSIYFDSMQTAAGTDYDYMSLPGVSTTGFFPIAMIGRNGSFNLNDAGASNISIPELWYFANQFNEPTLAKYRYYQISQQKLATSYKDILWYNESMLGDKDNISSLLSGMKTDSKYSGVEIVTFRDGFFDAGNYFVGFHGGQNGINHGHIDAGSFIYDAKSNGTEIRWAIDIGSENYNLYNMFGGSSSSVKSRWAYYRNRGEGHNTIIINPNEYADQPLNTIASINGYKTADKYAYASIDMQPIYGEYTDFAQRGVYFNKENGSLLVRDELTFNDDYKDLDNNLYWFMHTKAEIEVSADGKSAVLTQSGQRLWVGIIDGDQTFSVMNAVPLETSPNPNEWEENMANDGSSTNPKTQNANNGIRKLVINDKSAGGEWNLAVYMVLLNEGETAPAEIPENIAISSWN